MTAPRRRREPPGALLPPGCNSDDAGRHILLRKLRAPGTCAAAAAAAVVAGGCSPAPHPAAAPLRPGHAVRAPARPDPGAGQAAEISYTGMWDAMQAAGLTAD